MSRVRRETYRVIELIEPVFHLENTRENTLVIAKELFSQYQL